MAETGSGKYSLASDKDFDEFRSRCESDSDWKEAYQTNTTSVWTKKVCQH